MHMIGRRGAALRAVVDDKVGRQSDRNIEHVSEFAGYVLESMIPVDDRKMMIDDGKWIEVDDVVLTEWDSLLFRIEISGAQKAGPPGDGFCIHRCRRASRTVGNVPDRDIKPVNPDRARLCLGQPLDSTSK